MRITQFRIGLHCQPNHSPQSNQSRNNNRWCNDKIVVPRNGRVSSDSCRRSRSSLVVRFMMIIITFFTITIVLLSPLQPLSNRNPSTRKLLNPPPTKSTSSMDEKTRNQNRIVQSKNASEEHWQLRIVECMCCGVDVDGCVVPLLHHVAKQHDGR